MRSGIGDFAVSKRARELCTNWRYLEKRVINKRIESGGFWGPIGGKMYDWSVWCSSNT
jgi:hypothetical protein